MLKIAYLTTWLPRACGIATFADDLAMAVESLRDNLDWKIIAIDDPGSKYKYNPDRVIFKLNQFSPDSFIKTADFINKSNIDLLVIQHEFNLYNKTGEGRILSFLKLLHKPSVMIMHSIPHPKDRKYNRKKRKIEVMKKASRMVKQVIVMCSAAKKRLVDLYGIEKNKITVIPHGSPEFPYGDSEKMKSRLGFKNKKVLMNFGFIGRRKGIEDIIQSVHLVVKKHPDTVLAIIGGVNPSFRSGFQEYMQELQELIDKAKMHDNVKFVTKFVPIQKVGEYFQASDVFVYANNFKSQVSSGPLTYAVTAGKAIVTTDFTYAEDLLGQAGGFLVPSKKHSSMAKAICKIIANPVLQKKIEDRNYKLGRNFVWRHVAKKYVELFKKEASL